jgi:hypothetical protein
MRCGGTVQLVKFVQECVKQEYFVGQEIATQGEVGDSYYVLRRGKCSRGRVCHYVPISTERAQRYIRS